VFGDDEAIGATCPERLFAEDRAEDKIADPRVDLGSAALELGREGPRQRHRGHGLPGPGLVMVLQIRSSGIPMAFISLT
jgi:hypothetical protein